MFECCYRKKDICKPFAANSEEKIAFIQFIPFDTWYLSYKQCLSLSKQKALCFFSRKHCLSSSGKTIRDILITSVTNITWIYPKKLLSTYYLSRKHYLSLSKKRSIQHITSATNITGVYQTSLPPKQKHSILITFSSSYNGKKKSRPKSTNISPCYVQIMSHIIENIQKKHPWKKQNHQFRCHVHLSSGQLPPNPPL